MIQNIILIILTAAGVWACWASYLLSLRRFDSLVFHGLLATFISVMGITQILLPDEPQYQHNTTGSASIVDAYNNHVTQYNTEPSSCNKSGVYWNCHSKSRITQ